MAWHDQLVHLEQQLERLRVCIDRARRLNRCGASTRVIEEAEDAIDEMDLAIRVDQQRWPRLPPARRRA